MQKKKKIITEEFGEEWVGYTSDEILTFNEDTKKLERLKIALKDLYANRPIYNGREYSVLHKWYSQIEALIYG